MKNNISIHFTSRENTRSMADLFDPKKKNAYSSYRFYIKNYEMIWFRDFHDPSKFMKTNFFSMVIGFSASGRNILFTTFRDGIQKLIESGIIIRDLENEIHNEMQLSDTKIEKVTDDPQILTMTMLSAGFYLWIFMIILSFVAFVSEIFVSRFQNAKK